MRIEDIDPQRSRRAFEEAQLAQLRWLGLDWDEGPDVGGRYGPYRQSERSDAYAHALSQLDTYPCTCSRKDLAMIASAPEGGERVYDGRCLREGPKADRSAACRLHVAQDTQISFEDQIAGPYHQDVSRDVGDFVLRRHDGAWSYQLAVVVDDAAMDITSVVRGADLLTSTPRQIYLQRKLGYPQPEYAHVPLVVTDDGVKLSKRRPEQGPPLRSLAELMATGVDPREVVAAVARSLGLVPSTTRAVRPSELVGSFKLEALRQPPRDVSLVLDAPEQAPG